MPCCAWKGVMCTLKSSAEQDTIIPIIAHGSFCDELTGISLQLCPLGNTCAISLWDPVDRGLWWYSGGKEAAGPLIPWESICSQNSAQVKHIVKSSLLLACVELGMFLGSSIRSTHLDVAQCAYSSEHYDFKCSS